MASKGTSPTGTARPGGRRFGLDALASCAMGTDRPQQIRMFPHPIAVALHGMGEFRRQVGFCVSGLSRHDAGKRFRFGDWRVARDSRFHQLGEGSKRRRIDWPLLLQRRGGSPQINDLFDASRLGRARSAAVPVRLDGQEPERAHIREQNGPRGGEIPPDLVIALRRHGEFFKLRIGKLDFAAHHEERAACVVESDIRKIDAAARLFLARVDPHVKQ